MNINLAPSGVRPGMQEELFPHPSTVSVSVLEEELAALTEEERETKAALSVARQRLEEAVGAVDRLGDEAQKLVIRRRRMQELLARCEAEEE
jgi:hypothetical protein